MNDDGPVRGHRTLAHAADAAFEAWAPSRSECLAEAVQALVSSFAEVAEAGGPAAGAGGPASFTLEPGTGEDQLVHLLDEVIYYLDVHALVAVGAEVGEEPAQDSKQADGQGHGQGHGQGGARLRVRLSTVPAGQVALTGAVPKAVSLHGLSFGVERGQWVARVTVDV